MLHRFILTLLAALFVSSALAAAAEPDKREYEFPEFVGAFKHKPMTADETKAFMKELAKYVFEHHLKKTDGSPQRGMVYEYFDVARQGQFDQFVQGEALDTMHDGAWLCAALIGAYRATGDPFYKEFVTRWQLPFYCKMLNHSDELFTAKRNDARDGVKPFDREHALIAGEKGFVPYFWDDGASVSLERRQDKKPGGLFPCVDNLAGKDNPRHQLDGYSLGSSNHLAQDLGVMLQAAWLMLRDSRDEADIKLRKEVEEAAKNLHESRVRHHGNIPMVLAPHALITGDKKLLGAIPDPEDKRNWQPDNHYFKALYDFKPGQRYGTPGFADEQQYRYYSTLARTGGKLPAPVAFRLVYDALTEPQLYEIYCDDVRRLPGLNRFDLHGIFFKDGKPEDYRSDRKGPHKQPRPAGSRMGPQNMVMCGIGLQILKEQPKLLDQAERRTFPRGVEPAVFFQRELGQGLRVWEEVFRRKGYIPTSLGAGPAWDGFSDSGGYAHLIAAATQWLNHLEGRKDWELQFGK